MNLENSNPGTTTHHPASSTQGSPTSLQTSTVSTSTSISTILSGTTVLTTITSTSNSKTIPSEFYEEEIHRYVPPINIPCEPQDIFDTAFPKMPKFKVNNLVRLDQSSRNLEKSTKMLLCLNLTLSHFTVTEKIILEKLPTTERWLALDLAVINIHLFLEILRKFSKSPYLDLRNDICNGPEVSANSTAWKNINWIFSQVQQLHLVQFGECVDFYKILLNKVKFEWQKKFRATDMKINQVNVHHVNSLLQSWHLQILDISFGTSVPASFLEEVDQHSLKNARLVGHPNSPVPADVITNLFKSSYRWNCIILISSLVNYSALPLLFIPSRRTIQYANFSEVVMDSGNVFDVEMLKEVTNGKIFEFKLNSPIYKIGSNSSRAIIVKNLSRGLKPTLSKGFLVRFLLRSKCELSLGEGNDAIDVDIFKPSMGEEYYTLIVTSSIKEPNSNEAENNVVKIHNA
jgi:hypothetical protein